MEPDSLTPGQLRKARSLTQVQLAERLHITQPSLAALEGRDDPQFNSLRKYVEALGGILEVRAVFQDATYSLQLVKPGKRSA